MKFYAALAALFCIFLTQSAGAATSDPSPDIAILATSRDTTQLANACQSLLSSMFAAPGGDAAFRAIKTFILSGQNTPARVKCGRSLASVYYMRSYDLSNRSAVPSPFADRANAAILEMLNDADPAIRAGAAKALWGLHSPLDGRALLQHAQSDPSPDVVAAAFQNMFWGMNADVAESHDGKAYDDAIARGLASPHQNVIAAALTAYGGLHGLGADPLLRRYAVDKRPAVRLGAITAYDALMAYNGSITAFLETRLSDPDVDVRDRVMLELMRMGDIHAWPAINKLAHTAATADERASADAYARTIWRDALINTRPSAPHHSFSATSNGVRVDVSWSNKTTMVPGDPGPTFPVTSIAAGTVTISGANIAPFTTSLDQFDVSLAKSITVWVKDRSEGCGAVTRSAFLPNSASAPPYVVLFTIWAQKGCKPMALVFYPEKLSNRWRYNAAPAYGPALTSIKQYAPLTLLTKFKIATVRELALPSTPDPWHVWLVSGENSGKPSTVVLDFRDTAANYPVKVRPGDVYQLGVQGGGRVALYDSP